MSHPHVLTPYRDPSPAAHPDRPDTVNDGLTPNRPRRPVDNDEYASFARRVLRAYARRVATGDIDALTAMTDLSEEIDTAIGQAVTGLRSLRLLLGRHRHPARHHPPGRPATLGQPVTTTAATAALSPEPVPGPGLGATADDTETITWADFKAWERQLATTGNCSHPIRLTGRIEAIDLITGETAPVYDTAAEPGGVLHVACGNRRETVCPACSAVYKRDARQLVRAGPGRWQGRSRDDHWPSVRVRHPHRPLLRAGPLPADARQDRAALPPPPRCARAPLPARPRHLLPDPARRGRSPARAADVRRLLRLRSRRAVQRHAGDAVAPVHHLPAPPPGPPRWGHAEGAALGAAHPLRQGRRIPGTRRRPLPRRHPPRRHRPGLPAAPRPLHRRPAVRRHPPGHRRHQL